MSMAYTVAGYNDRHPSEILWQRQGSRTDLK